MKIIWSLAIFHLLLSGMPAWSKPATPQPNPDIALETLEIKVCATGQMVSTTYEFTVRNDAAMQRECTLEFPLESGQEVVAMALDIEGRLRDAVPVPKEKGRVAFEEIKNRRVDPALLENVGGSVYRLRIFPVMPKGVRKARVVIEEVLQMNEKGELPYRLPLDFGKTLESLQLRVEVVDMEKKPKAEFGQNQLSLGWENQAWVGTSSATRVPPSAALQLVLWPNAEPESVLAAGVTASEAGYFLAQTVLPRSSENKLKFKKLALLWDVSLSATGQDQTQLYRGLEALFQQMESVEIVLVPFHFAALPAASYTIRNGDWSKLKQELQAMSCDGGSSLEVLRSLPKADAVLLVSDGLETFGHGGSPTLSQPLFIWNTAARANPGRLESLAEASGGRYFDLRRVAPEEAARQLFWPSWRVEKKDYRQSALDRVQTRFATAPDGRAYFEISGEMLVQEAQLSVTLTNGREKVTFPVQLRSRDSGELAYSLRRQWARMQHQVLSRQDRQQADKFAQEYGLVTESTSLIVLETLGDYLRYEIKPPAELREAYEQARQSRNKSALSEEQQVLEQVADWWQRRRQWWEGKLAKKDKEKTLRLEEARVHTMMAAPRMAESPAPTDADDFAVMAGAPASGEVSEQVVAMSMAPARGSEEGETVELAAFSVGRRVADKQPEAASPATVTLKSWTSGSLPMRRLAKAEAMEEWLSLYREIQVEERLNSGFYLEAAQNLIDRGERDLALRVLSNLAELEAENVALLRILGYQLRNFAFFEKAEWVFRRVLELRAEEPQSYRDLALTLARLEREQEAIELLYRVVRQRWNRPISINLTCLADLNGIVHASKKKLDTSFVESRLLGNMPLDLRVVLTWDRDHTDIDLHLTDPDGETCFFQNRQTVMGCMLWDDVTDGFGPEEMTLRKAKPGTYKIAAKYYGQRNIDPFGPATLQVEVILHFGTPHQERQQIIYRLSEKNEVAEVGVIEVP